MKETGTAFQRLPGAGEALATGAKNVATACPFCMAMMADGVKAHSHEDVAVKDVAELLAEAMGLLEGA